MSQTHKTTQNTYKAHKERRCRDLRSNGIISSCEKSSLAASALSSSHPHPSHTLTHPTPSSIPHPHPPHTLTHPTPHPPHTLRKILAELQSMAETLFPDTNSAAEANWSNPVTETSEQSPECTFWGLNIPK